MKYNKYNKTKIAIAVLLAGQGFYYAITQPGPMDCINGIIHGLVFYALFCIEDPKPEKSVEEKYNFREFGPERKNDFGDVNPSNKAFLMDDGSVKIVPNEQE